MKDNIVFAFLYTDCLYEYDTRIISIHRTRKGAEKAIEKHKGQEKKRWDVLNRYYKSLSKFGYMQIWEVVEMEIKP